MVHWCDLTILTADLLGQGRHASLFPAWCLRPSSCSSVWVPRSVSSSSCSNAGLLREESSRRRALLLEALRLRFSPVNNSVRPLARTSQNRQRFRDWMPSTSWHSLSLSSYDHLCYWHCMHMSMQESSRRIPLSSFLSYIGMSTDSFRLPTDTVNLTEEKSAFLSSSIESYYNRSPNDRWDQGNDYWNHPRILI